MKRRNLVTKVASVAASASMVAGLFPVSAMAVTGDKIAADGTYTANTAVVTDDDESWQDYDISVSVAVSDGKIASINVTPGETSIPDNKKYIDRATNGYTKKNFVGCNEALVGQAATEESVESWDADVTSSATVVATAIKSALKTAINSAPEAAVIDTSALEQAISDAANYAEADYTADSWKTFSDALAAANSALEAKESQSAIDAAEASLKSAIDALVKAEKEYKYVYAALTYQEYWSAEDVLAGNSAESSSTYDTNGELDKGAFDTVTRATANHGLHRGNFQQDVTVYDKEGNTYELSYWASKTEVVLTDGTTIGLSGGKITLASGDIKEVDHYEITGIKYVPVKVAAEDYDAFKEAYDVVENGDTLAGGYSENNLVSYSGLVASVDENTNGLKEATKNEDGSFSFGERQTGTGSGIEGSELKTVSLTPVVQDTSKFGDFIRVDVKDNYGEIAAMMQTVEWTYYGDSDTALASFGTKFAADNWMHKSNGIQLGLTDSLRCQLPEGYDGTGKWEVTIYALGYADTTLTFNITADDIHASTPVSDTSALEEAIAKAEALDQSKYTEDSWSNMQAELKEAKDDLALVATGKTSQESIDESTNHLNEAIEALVEVEKEYKYVYAALTYQEYWSAEDVLAGNSAESSSTYDTNGELDKGAFDTVTRATANHGLHRGNFQQDVTVYDKEGNTYELSYWASKTEVVLTDGTTIGLSGGKITLASGDIKEVDHYEITGIKYVPVKVAAEDYDAFKEAYDVVENGDTLAGGYSENNLVSYSGLVASVDENTNGLKEATKNEDGSFSFGERQTGTGSGIEGSELKTVSLTPVVQDTSKFGDFIRVDVKDNYGEIAAMMQTVEWTYYGDSDTALASFGTKFAADNWMHKSNGIQLGLTDSLRCQLPEGYDGTGKWEVTIYALGYADTTLTFNITADDIHASTPVSDTSALEEAIAKAEALDQSKYTEDSWSNMQAELKEAKDDLALVATGKTSQESIDESTNHLNEAIEALEVIPHEHDYGEWSLIQVPSADSKALEARICSFCNLVETREIETQPGLNIIYGTPYVYDENNSFVTNGTPSVNGVKYYVQNGIAQTGLLKLGNWQMYADPETYELATGLKEIDGKTYLFDKNGVEILKSRTEVIDGKKYWFQEDGSLKSGWSVLGNWTMYFDPETFEAAIGVNEIEGKTYLFDANGVLYNGSGTPVVNGKKYYVVNGELKSGWLKLANWQMYFDPETYEAAVGVTKIDGKAYLFDKNGVEILKSRTEVIDGKKYWFQPDGTLMSGWCKLGNWTMYFDPETYAAATGTVRIDGTDYSFDANGVLIGD